MKWRQIVPSIVTLTAMLAGFLSILLTFEGMRTGNRAYPYYLWSAQLIMIAMIFDGLDGNLARMLNGKSEFGAELDTYVDLTAFGIAPAILVFAVTFRNEGSPLLLRVLLPSAVALSGVVRLARFKVKDPDRGQSGYAGLPITANAAWVALFVLIGEATSAGSGRGVFSLKQGWFAALFLAGILVFIMLQVTNLRYPKPTKKAAIFIPCVVLVILLMLLKQKWAALVAAVMILLGLVYVGIGPLFVKGVEAHRARRESKMNGEND
ncbi:MAG: CDP-alcohol phosphatidyltransferase family protein [Kiritimatiellia bacterium]